MRSPTCPALQLPDPLVELVAGHSVLVTAVKVGPDANFVAAKLRQATSRMIYCTTDGLQVLVAFSYRVKGFGLATQ